MRPEDEVLFACCRQDFRPADRARVEAVAAAAPLDWERLAAAAERHGVAPLVGANLARCASGIPGGMPVEISARFERALLANAAYKLRERERLAAALRDLAAVGYEALLLKGAALDLAVYREPWMTVSRDLDLAVRPQPGRDPGEAGRQVRLRLYRSGIECDLTGHHDVSMSGVLPVPWERIWAEARPVAPAVGGAHDGGRPAPRIPAPADLVLSLAVNACRRRYFHLKALLDLAETVRAFPDLDWREVGERARAWRSTAIAWTALAAACATLGCELPPSALDGLGVPAPRRRLLAGLLAALLRAGSIAHGRLVGGGARGRLLGRSLEGSLLLVYAGLGPGQLARSLRGAVLHLPPELRAMRPGRQAHPGRRALSSSGSGASSRAAGEPAKSSGADAAGAGTSS
jgi:putative nucleotidyltransferase-like protein